MSEKMTTANSAEQGKVDIDFAECAVPKWSRRRFVTMFMIMLGFTFFSASMWVGQEMAAGLDFWGFIKALLLGGAILGIYTGPVSYTHLDVYKRQWHKMLFQLPLESVPDGAAPSRIWDPAVH